MSVHDPEPKIPNDDNGKGLRMIGWLLLLWTGITFIWIPFHVRDANFMKWVDIGCFIGGVFFVALGYYVGRRAPSDIEVDERAHDMMMASGGAGAQNDEPAVGDGPGRFPRPAAR